MNLMSDDLISITENERRRLSVYQIGFLPKTNAVNSGCTTSKYSQKCEFLRVTNTKHPILAQYSIQKETIREVTHAKYLGVTIDRHLSWSEHIKQS